MAFPKKELETEEEDKVESPASEKVEDKTEGGIIPEDFQRNVKSLIDSCDDEHCLTYIRTCLTKKEDEMRESKMNKTKPSGKTVPAVFDDEEMPE
jgi:hypothetical protein